MSTNLMHYWQMIYYCISYYYDTKKVLGLWGTLDKKIKGSQIFQLLDFLSSQFTKNRTC